MLDSVTTECRSSLCLSKFIVRAVRTDPEPNEAIHALLCQRSIAKSNPCRPEWPHFLKANRGVTWVGLKQLEFLVGKSAHLLWQLPITMPELLGSEVLQSGVQRPASKSSSARFPAASKRPAAMSASICPSHWSAANSSNHSRKRANSASDRCETADSRSSTLMVQNYRQSLGLQIFHAWLAPSRQQNLYRG
jgi:hypothetical protein